MVPVSARQKTGIETLLEMILLIAEVQELKANPHGLAQGVVVESKLEKGRGPIATVLIRNGTIKLGRPDRSGSDFRKSPGADQR